MEDAYHDFISKLQSFIDKYAPIRKITIPQKLIIRDPWMTKGLIKSSSTCTKLYQTCVTKAKTNPDYEKYITYRNQYNILRKSTKQNYYAKLLKDHENDIRKTWQTINSVIGKSNDKSTITTTFTINNEDTTDPNLISNTFADYFTNIGPTFANQIPESTKSHFDYITYPVKNVFIHSFINSFNVCYYESMLNTNKGELDDTVLFHGISVQSHSRRRYTRCALGRLHIAHRRAEVRRSRITPDYFEDKRALIFSRRRRRDRAHSRARGCFEHMDFPEMCKLKCCESALVKIATKLRKQRAN